MSRVVPKDHYGFFCDVLFLHLIRFPMTCTRAAVVTENKRIVSRKEASPHYRRLGLPLALRVGSVAESDRYGLMRQVLQPYATQRRLQILWQTTHTKALT